MILHVAEAGEQRGRVVLQLTSNEPNPVALQAALRIAQAFRSEIESLFVEDHQLVALASFPFAREVSLSGRRTRALSPESMAREMHLMAQAISRRVRASGARSRGALPAQDRARRAGAGAGGGVR